MSTPSTTSSERELARNRARGLVDEITKDHGFVRKSTYARMDPEAQREVEEAMLMKDKLIGSSTITLAKNLYNSSARFVFELLQNADDNSYSKARSSSSIPFVSFHVYSHQIVVECNEDGFTQENLSAICNVGQSSKTGGQGYIGEKGIGFKSVFMVAWKVHIQSGDFSFYFEHKKGDSGMGMITPVWEDEDIILDGPLTRITLFLHETGLEAQDRQQETTLQQFRELQATFLLFMKNLQRIEVSMYEGDQVSTTTFSMHRQSQNRVTLERQTTESGNVQQHMQHFYIYKATALGLPQSENRTYTAAELSNKTYAYADVVLAFPLTPDSVPIVETQDVFAFLPIRNMGFPFLIHSDFVTDANRQDIVRTSPRNERLLRMIGDSFVKAVLEFCQHPTLRYQWMRYLPSRYSHVQDGVWTTLVEAIHYVLKEIPVLWTRSHKERRLIKDMRRLSPDVLDKHNSPLYPDLEPEEYLPPQYLAKDLDLLKDYGLCYLKANEFLIRVRKDLNQQESSIMMSPHTDNDWHSRVAKVLLKIWPKYSEVNDLTLIPTRYGTWISANNAYSNPIYYPDVNGYKIPQNLKLRVLDPEAQKNYDRKQLFGCLGVQEAGLLTIRQAIRDHNTKYDVIMVNTRINLEFLYLTAYLLPLDDRSDIGSTFEIFDHMQRKRLWDGNIYFPSEDPYGAQNLLQSTRIEGVQTIPGLDVPLLNAHYMSRPPAQPDNEARTWRIWLSEKFNIRDIIPLSSRGISLSDECLYVARYRPDKFLGFLLKYWRSEGSKITENQALTHELLNVKVLCRDGTLHPLGKTYVYGKELEYASTFILEGEFFPWLKKEASSCDTSGLPDLEILTSALDFGYPKSELEFYLTILQYVKSANEDANKLADVDRVYELYSRIKTRCLESGDSSISRQTILDTFKSKSLIFIPAHGDDNAEWTSPDRCRWEAPAALSIKYPLKARYSDVKSTKRFVDLFLDTLEIPNAGTYDFFDDLQMHRLHNTGTFGHFYELYQELDLRRREMDSETVKKIQESFESRGLIRYADKDTVGWYKPSECLWATATDIKGMVVLHGLYEDMQCFFIEFLGVRTLTLEMVHDKLLEQAARGASIHEVKETIWLLNSYLRDEEKPPSPKEVIGSRVFPVRYPNNAVQLCSSTSGFSIKDRKHLSDMFSEKAKFLDFDVNDTPRLKPFLRWTGLEGRYLSSSVREMSRLCDDYHQPTTRPDRQVARKAYALLRIAVHYRSPRALNNQRDFYDWLKNIDVRETDGIRSEIHLNQDGNNDISIEVSRSELHFDENDDGLTIYVPRDEKLQYLCFYDRLPRELLEQIMADPTTRICEPFDERTVNIVHQTLHAQDTYLASILDRAGIMAVEIPEDESNDNLEVTTPNSQSSAEQSNLAQTPESSTLQADTDEFTTSFSRASDARSRVVGHDGHSTGGTPQPRTAVPSGFDINLLIASKYRGLLSRVVAAARRTTLPEISQHFDYSPTIIYSNEDSWLDRLERGERDKRIGAAGEMFVFEVLSRLDSALPGFSRDNWQSTIRHYVRVHDEYSDMQPWQGMETADFRYTDTNGTLTSFLINKGYLRSNIWSGKRPEYFLEVKSSTGPCETAFYMSKYQYRRAQNLSCNHSDSGDPDPGSGNYGAIYVIIRIFNLLQDSVGMKIYVDPDALRRQEELLFTAETWSIVPGVARGHLPN